MRLVVATRQLGFAGGVEMHLQSVLPRLLARGHSLAVLHEHSALEAPDLVLKDCPLIPRIEAGQRPVDEVLDEYPSLTDDDVRASLAFGAKMSAGRYVDVA